MVLFFFLGAYVLYGVTRFVLRKNRTLEELNAGLTELYDISADLLHDIEAQGFVDALSERLKDHIPSTYCVVMLLDEKMNLVTRLACPVRALRWEPSIGMVFGQGELARAREVLETRQPKVLRLDSDEIDADLKKIITRETQSLLLVPIRIAAENAGILIFGEERRWERDAFSPERIQLGVAIGRQVASALNLSWCHGRLEEAQHSLKVAHDKVIKAERLATLGEVTRAVEHEINNPLSVIVNWAEIYREDQAIDAEIRNKFQLIYDMAMRIGSVVKKLAELKDVKSVEFMKGQKMTELDPSSGQSS
jgi:C4-dicarboxylate-specific signal transduction histidine kinase